MSDPSLWWAVASGGAFGALLRGAVYAAFAMRTEIHPERAWEGLGAARATLIVNLAGSFLLGALTRLTPMGLADEPLRIFLVTGLCGSLTTFSSVCLDAVGLARASRRSLLIGYLLANGLLSVAAFSLGRLGLTILG